MKHRPIQLLVLAALLCAATAAQAIRPLGPYPIGAKAKAKPATHTQQLLRDAQARIAPYRQTTPAAAATPPAQLRIPNLPGNTPGPSPASLGRNYTQEELTRTWAPYTYP